MHFWSPHHRKEIVTLQKAHSKPNPSDGATALREDTRKVQASLLKEKTGCYDRDLKIMKAAERAHTELPFTKSCNTGTKGESLKIAGDQMKTD